jgi:uncharacterized BrkB/YihY/UPF0761 family membrane protein
MATDTSAAPEAGSSSASRRIRPHQVVLLVGVGVALVTAASGIFATITQWHDESDVTRAVFGNIPSALRLLFYTVLPILFVAGAYLFSLRVRNWERGR